MSGITVEAAAETMRRIAGDSAGEPRLRLADLALVTETEGAAADFSVEWQIVVEPESSH